MPFQKFVLEVAIYRRSEAAFDSKLERDLKYYMEHNKYVKLCRPRPGMELDPRTKERIEARYRRDYPSPWRYNNIIGYIHVFFFWDQIRGDLWLVENIGEGRRFRGRRMKRFHQPFEAFQTLIPRDPTNEDLSRDIREQLIEAVDRLCRGGHLPKGVTVDLEAFDNIAPHIDWRGLIASF